MTIQLGAYFPTRDMPPDRAAIRDWAQAAEGIGYDYIEVSDHVLGADRAALPDFKGNYDLNDSFHECWIRVKNGGPDEWRAAVDQWRALGVTHVTFYTTGQGLGPLDKQIEAMRRFSEAIR